MAAQAAGLFLPAVAGGLAAPGRRRGCGGAAAPSRRTAAGRISAQLGGEKKPEKKFITRDEEPEQYWQTAGEREGENPMKTPLPYIIIFGMSTPFIILAVAFANGWIKVPIR
ncbi:unnamed protein product [Spirodela intermedia]|uniref:Uncharacterized protein n=1 Tax=Spirodela intermedia TaxID=51605 RepID=A0A7I8K797_SPIIN|nr:unnamed protein product [Spirodela intermedia]